MSKISVVKRFVAAVLTAAVCVSLFGCKGPKQNIETIKPTGSPSYDTEETVSPSATDKIVWDDEWISESTPGKTTPVPEDFIDGTVMNSDMADTVKYSNTVANKIQAAYTDGTRFAYGVTNQNIGLTEKLYAGESFGTTIANKSGATYFNDSLEVYAIDNNDAEYGVFFGNSDPKINTTKLGYYYYDVNVRNLNMSYTDSVGYPKIPSVDLNPSLWRTNDMSAPYTDSNGYLATKVTNDHDPYFYIKGLDIDGKVVNAVEITVKTDAPSHHCALYFYTVDKGGFNADQMSSFKLKTDGKFHTYLVAVDNYEKNIAGIRFDIGTAAGQNITVKNIRFAHVKYPETPIAAEKTFHSYPDKMHFEASVLATSESSPVTDIKEYGYKVTFKKSEIKSMTLGIDGKSVSPSMLKVYQNPEYIGFNTKNAGVAGFIMPNDSVSYGLKISETDTEYTVYMFNRINKIIKFGNPVSLSSRIYTDTTHSFDGLVKVAKQERNPFTHITVKSSQKGAFNGYDYAKGAYVFTINGTDFSSAYRPSGKNKYYTSDISVTASDDRVVYVSMETGYGGLEGAAVTTKDGVSLPIPIEVCKNFKGEIEEPIYDPEDDSYGYSIMPLKTTKNKKYEFKLYHLYQNWGKYPIKQISSIGFHVSYYHLSTGVTESNCIAPYYVYGKDGWTLPDFRGASGEMWSSQPQFNSVGRLYFTKHKDKDGNFVLSEYTGSVIHSSGNTYADMNYSYIADDGAYAYDLRHFELPQTDENRTMYEVSLEFLNDTSFDDVKNDLSLFSFDGRSVIFDKASFLNQNNKKQVITNKNRGTYSDIYVLGKENPYFSYYDFEYNGSDTTSGMNFGLVVCDSSVTVGGKSWNGNFVFKNEFDGKLNIGSLSFNMGKTTFKKGDKISLTLILLPYGLPNAKNSNNVDYVIEDSVKSPFRITAEKGTVITDAFLPSVKCVNNETIITVKGGRNNQVIKTTGYTKLGIPKIYEKINGKWQEYDYHVKGNYDGYSVQYENGQYSYSIVYDMGNNPATAQSTFKIVIE